jgi:hypothetical protein
MSRDASRFRRRPDRSTLTIIEPRPACRKEKSDQFAADRRNRDPIDDKNL